jgi:hypothetical protein
MSNSPIRGTVILTFDDDGTRRRFVAMSEASLNIKTGMLSAASPDAYGWEYGIPALKSWSISCSLFHVVEGSTLRRPEAQRRLDRMAHDSARLTVTFETPYGATYTGDAYVTDQGITGSVSGSSQASYSLQGAGPLTLTETEFTCGLESFAGSNEAAENTHYIGTTAGWVHMPWYGGSSIPDLFEILYDGAVVATTEVPVIEHGTLSFYYSAEIGSPRTCVVRITPSPDPDTFWSYILRCPVASETYTGPLAPLP